MPKVYQTDRVIFPIRTQKKGVVIVDATVKEAWGDWLSDNWQWEWFVTLTFRHDSVGRGKADSLWRRWVRDIEKAAQKAPAFVRVTEYQRYRGVPHYHALMMNVEGLRRLKWLDRWVSLAGWARVLPYDYRHGASYYVSKYIAKDIAEVLLSDNLGEHAVSSHRAEQLRFLGELWHDGRENRTKRTRHV